ncbi:MAG TPA: hypothetical protein VMZ91_14755 [Candidatus Paceibacterota bacterium]|nr:hypothetical protein [Candidatus Paceibacterota bacterium]
MGNKNNKSLFWYGFRAKVKEFFGGVLLFIGLSLGMISIINENAFWIIGLICIIFGTVLFFKGHSQRFDYKQQSGTMIHRGDW